MISQNDLRLRQAKKKIFFEEPHRHKPEEKTSQNNNGKVVQSDIMRTGSIVQQLRKQVQELESNNIELKKLLKQQRIRYDKLFEEYEETTQKNSVIEKQYINLKYEHNKQIKELKNSISSIISEKITKALQEFQMSIKQDKIAQSLKNKLEKLLEKIKELPRISEKFKKKKTSKKGSEIYQLIEERPSMSHISQRSQQMQKKIEFFQLQEQHITKTSTSPEKEKSLKSIKSQSDVSNRQTFVFEDQYYGQIQDFSHYEQKIIQRRNYELMKRNSRASNQIKRKKIFEQV